MRSQGLLWSVFLWQPLAALSIQQHVAQFPMLSDRRHTTRSADPDSISIEAAVDLQGQYLLVEELERVMCQTMLRFSAEKAALELSGQEKIWPWFRFKDQVVLFKESSSRWFLAGRAIANYECR
jgi:hypothetical protein